MGESAMIVDKITNFALYTALHENLPKAFDFIKRALEENLPAGRYEIEGDALYASVQEYETHAAEEAKFEGHRRYIDLQFVVSGTESIDVIDIEKAETVAEYDPAIEAAFYHAKQTPHSCTLSDGDFAILFPHDLHSPGIHADGAPCKMKKIIVKIGIVEDDGK